MKGAFKEASGRSLKSAWERRVFTSQHTSRPDHHPVIIIRVTSLKQLDLPPRVAAPGHEEHSQGVRLCLWAFEVGPAAGRPNGSCCRHRSVRSGEVEGRRDLTRNWNRFSENLVLEAGARGLLGFLGFFFHTVHTPETELYIDEGDPLIDCFGVSWFPACGPLDAHDSLVRPSPHVGNV